MSDTPVFLVKEDVEAYYAQLKQAQENAMPVGVKNAPTTSLSTVLDWRMFAFGAFFFLILAQIMSRIFV